MATNHDKIERVAIAATVLVGDAAWQGFQSCTKSFFIGIVDDLVFAVQFINENPACPVVSAESRDGRENREGLVFAARDQVYLDHFYTLVEMGEDETGHRRARGYRITNGQCTKALLEHLQGFILVRGRKGSG